MTTTWSICTDTWKRAGTGMIMITSITMITTTIIITMTTITTTIIIMTMSITTTITMITDTTITTPG